MQVAWMRVNKPKLSGEHMNLSGGTLKNSREYPLETISNVHSSKCGLGPHLEEVGQLGSTCSTRESCFLSSGISILFVPSLEGDSSHSLVKEWLFVLWLVEAPALAFAFCSILKVRMLTSKGIGSRSPPVWSLERLGHGFLLSRVTISILLR